MQSCSEPVFVSEIRNLFDILLTHNFTQGDNLMRNYKLSFNQSKFIPFVDFEHYNLNQINQLE
jgi:hypothetical protein